MWVGWSGKAWAKPTVWCVTCPAGAGRWLCDRTARLRLATATANNYIDKHIFAQAQLRICTCPLCSDAVFAGGRISLLLGILPTGKRAGWEPMSVAAAPRKPASKSGIC